MSTNVKVFLIAVISAILISMIPDERKNLATVNMQDGYYIFIQCKPVASYDSLGEVKKTGLVMSGSPKEMFNTLLRRAKKDFPKCDALIFSDIQMEHATCIKFK